MFPTLSTLIRAIEDADSSARLLDAVRNLAAAKNVEAVPTLVKILSFNNPGAAVAAVDGIVLIGSAAVPAVMEQLDQHNYTARAWAIRALAGIGDPRGLITLLGAATADFSVSVRRAAARGLGAMKWGWFPAELRDIAQEEVLEALLFVADQDDEWVVRYAAIAGLQSLFVSINKPEWQQRIRSQWQVTLEKEVSVAVKARAWLAQSRLPEPNPAQELPPSLSPIDWQDIMEKLCARKGLERRSLSVNDPENYRDMAGAILQGTH